MNQLTNGIRKTLLTILNNKIIAMSWGISGINVEKDKLSFNVSGLKFAGRIEITTPNLCHIKIGDKTFVCEMRNLVSVIDKEVETDKDYISILKKQIYLTKK